MNRSKYLIVLLFAGLLVNENIVQWALAVKVGGMSAIDGFKDAFEFFTMGGYLFFTAFRLIPYTCLAVSLLILSKTRFSHHGLTVFWGGLVGILLIIILGSWEAMRPYYSEKHVSSTTALSFLIIPFYAVPAGGCGAVILSLLFTPFRFFRKRSQSKSIAS